MREDKMIDELRKNIDEIDNEIIKLLDKRFDVAKAIGEEKKKISKQVLDQSREQAILDKVDKLSSDEHSKYIQEIYKKIMEQSREYQGK